MFSAKLARLEAEKVRLAATRVPADHAVAAAAVAASGHAVTGPITLDQLLRRPHVHYE